MLARALLSSGRPARHAVWCDRSQHRLAQVFEVPGRGPVLVFAESHRLPPEEFTAERQELTAVDWSEVQDWAPDTGVWTACQHGVYLISADRLRAMVAAGTRDTLATRSFRSSR